MNGAEMAAGIIGNVDSALKEMTNQMMGTPEDESVAGADNLNEQSTIILS